MYKILTINNLAAKGLERFSPDNYHVGPDLSAVDALILRSHKLHNETIDESVIAVLSIVIQLVITIVALPMGVAIMIMAMRHQHQKSVSAGEIFRHFGSTFRLLFVYILQMILILIGHAEHHFDRHADAFFVGRFRSIEQEVLSGELFESDGAVAVGIVFF